VLYRHAHLHDEVVREVRPPRRHCGYGLLGAIERVERGTIDADLGGGLIKQRVARPGKGRSAGYRVIVAYRTKERAVFLFGFAKSKRETSALMN
jgi:hypothetical protein